MFKKKLLTFRTEYLQIIHAIINKIGKRFYCLQRSLLNEIHYIELLALLLRGEDRRFTSVMVDTQAKNLEIWKNLCLGKE